MRGWPILLGGLVVWAAHFFVVYGLAEFAPDSRPTRIAIVVLTIAALATQCLIVAACLRSRGDGFEQWQRQIGTAAAVLGAIGVVWQGLPPLF